MRLRGRIADVALLLARVAIGVTFVAHGWQNLAGTGMDGTTAFFAQVGVPLPAVSAWLATFIELVCGAALIVGIAVPAMALILVADMFGAFLFVHASNGLFVQQNGFELVMALAAGCLALVATGAGRYSVDGAIFERVAATRTTGDVRSAVPAGTAGGRVG